MLLFRFKYYALPELFHNKVSKKGIGMDFNDYLCTNKKNVNNAENIRSRSGDAGVAYP